MYINTMLFKKVHSLWFICILLRVIIALLPLIYFYLIKNNYYIKIVNKISYFNRIIILVIGIGFLYKALFGSNEEIQVIKVFWHKTRIIHAILFIIAGIYFNNYKLASLILFSDIIFSIFYRFCEGHFN